MFPLNLLMHCNYVVSLMTGHLVQFLLNTNQTHLTSRITDITKLDSEDMVTRSSFFFATYERTKC
jgi:hypothetical protein